MLRNLCGKFNISVIFNWCRGTSCISMDSWHLDRWSDFVLPGGWLSCGAHFREKTRRYMCVSHVYLKRYVQYGMWYVHLCPWLRITCIFSRKKQALDGITLYPGNSSSWYGDDSNGLVSSWPCWEPQAHPQTYPKWCVQSHPANIRFPYNGPQNKIVLLKLSEGPNNDLNATYHNHAPLGLNMLG